MQTQDGFIFKRIREDRGLVTSEAIYTRSSRYNEDQPLGIFQIELSDKILYVLRTYPTFLDLIGNIGGTVEVIVFVITVFLGFYMGIILE